MKKVLAFLSINPDYVEFAIPQLKSLLQNLKIPFHQLFSLSNPLPQQQYLIDHLSLKNFPFITLTVPDFETNRKYFLQAAKKAIMVNKFVLLISSGKNYEQLMQNKDEEILKAQCRSWDDLVACDFHSRNRVQERSYQKKKIHKIFQQMDVRGKIDIDNAPKRFQLIQDHRWYQGHHETDPQYTLQNVYFGIQLSKCRQGKAKFNAKYQLGKRIYLGPTSADNDLAFMMANQANIGSGSLVFDPFVGTGGLLIPPASMGAYTFGSDLDVRVINGYSVGRINKKSPYYNLEKKLQLFTPKIYLNFDQYGFIRPFIFRMDCINPCFRKLEFFDAIICDPPYGLRAMSRTVAQKKEQVKQEHIEEIAQLQLQETQQEEQKVQISEEELKKIQQLDQVEKKKALKKIQKKKQRKENKVKRNQMMTQEEREYKNKVIKKLTNQRVTQWEKYDKNKIETTQKQKIFNGLLNLARQYLKQGGRLVFLYPVYEDQKFEGVEDLPDHDGFKVIDYSKNIMGKGNARILVTLQKKIKMTV